MLKWRLYWAYFTISIPGVFLRIKQEVTNDFKGFVTHGLKGTNFLYNNIYWHGQNVNTVKLKNQTLKSEFTFPSHWNKKLLSNRKGGCRRRAIFSNLSLSFSEKTLLCTLGLLKRTNKSVFERKWNFVCSSNIRADGCKRRLSKDSSHIKQNTATFYLWNR